MNGTGDNATLPLPLATLLKLVEVDNEDVVLADEANDVVISISILIGRCE